MGSALEDYDAVISMNPGFDQAYISRAAIHTKQGRFQAAEADYNQVLKKNPEESTRQKLEELQVAIQEMEKAVGLVQAGNCEEALEHINRVMEKAPLFDKPRLLRAQCFLQMGDADSAGVDLKLVAFYSLAWRLYS